MDLLSVNYFEKIIDRLFKLAYLIIVIVNYTCVVVKTNIAYLLTQFPFVFQILLTDHNTIFNSIPSWLLLFLLNELICFLRSHAVVSIKHRFTLFTTAIFYIDFVDALSEEISILVLETKKKETVNWEYNRQKCTQTCEIAYHITFWIVYMIALIKAEYHSSSRLLIFIKVKIGVYFLVIKGYLLLLIFNFFLPKVILSCLQNQINIVSNIDGLRSRIVSMITIQHIVLNLLSFSAHNWTIE